jgi:hypothetical protein
MKMPGHLLHSVHHATGFNLEATLVSSVWLSTAAILFCNNKNPPSVPPDKVGSLMGDIDSTSAVHFAHRTAPVRKGLPADSWHTADVHARDLQRDAASAVAILLRLCHNIVSQQTTDKGMLFLCSANDPR